MLKLAKIISFLAIVCSLTLISVSYPLEQPQIKQDVLGGAGASLLTGLQAYWNFNESSGNASSAVNNNTLTNINSVSYTTGKINNGVRFASSSLNYFKIASTSQTGLVEITSDFSLSLWVNIDAQPSGVYPYYQLINKWNEYTDQRGFALLYANNLASPYLYFATSAGGADADPTSFYFLTKTLTPSSWYHLVIAWDASISTAYFYINNTLEGIVVGDPAQTSMHSSSADLQIGVQLDEETPAGRGYWDGMEDELGIWSRLVTSTEVSTLYSSGNGLSYPFGEDLTNNSVTNFGKNLILKSGVIIK
jgi:hypothetical protein